MNPVVEELIAEALEAASGGDVVSARQLAGEALRRDPDNRDAAEIAKLSDSSPAELRRLTILFCDLVGSTAMSVRHDPGEYGRILETYHRHCEDVIVANGGRVTRRVGDGVLALFGHPVSHGDDTRRAVRAGRALVQRISTMGAQLDDSVEEALSVRVAVHHGLVHLDLVESQVYGLAPNLAARLQELAQPDQVVVSPEVASILGALFTFEQHAAVELKGIEGAQSYLVVLDEPPETPSRGRPWATGFINRTEERKLLADFVNGDGDSGPSVLVVQGEAGLGKSRLVHEALGEAEHLPQRILAGVCSPYETSDDLRAIRPFLGLSDHADIVDQGARLRQLRADLVTLDLDPDAEAPLLAPVLGLDPSVGFEPHASDISRLAELTTSAIRRFITALGSAGGAVLRIDDLQWADRSTLTLLLGFAADPIAGVKVLATNRPGPTLEPSKGLAVLELDPLGASDALALATEVLPDIGGAALRQVLARGHGVPLFLEELAAVGEIEEVPPEMRARLSETSAVPAVLYEPLLARLSRPEVELRVAQVAATIGTSFELEVLGASMQGSSPRLERSVEALVQAGVIVKSKPGKFEFRHGLVRDLAYDLQTTDDRRETHRRVGLALRARNLDRSDESWAVIAGHFHSAGSTQEAVEAYVRAAEQTRDLGGLEAAKALLSTALELIVQLPDNDQRRLLEVTTRLQRAFLSVTMAGNADPEARADYDACEILVQAQSAGPEFVDTLVSLWGYHTARGSLERAAELLDEIRATGVCDDPYYDAQNLGAKGLIAVLRGDYSAATTAFDAADAVRPAASAQDLEPSRWQFPNDPMAVEATFRGVLAWQLGDQAASSAWFRRGRHRAESLGFPHGPFSLCYVLHYSVWVDIETGELERARRSVDELLGLAARHGFDFWSLSGGSLSSTLNACVELAKPVPDLALLRAESDQQSAFGSVITMIDSRAFVPFGLTRQAAWLGLIEGHEAALAILDRAERIADATGARFYLAETWRIRGRLLASRHPERAFQAVRTAIDIAHSQGAVVFEQRARADLAALGET